jgi:hypothetical protein
MQRPQVSAIDFGSAIELYGGICDESLFPNERKANAWAILAARSCLPGHDFSVLLADAIFGPEQLR